MCGKLLTGQIMPVSHRVCIACRHKDNQEILESVDRGDMSHLSAANHFGVSLDTWRKHVRNHIVPQIQALLSTDVSVLAASVIKPIEEMEDMVQRLKNQIEKIITVSEEGDDMDVKSLQAYTGMEKALAGVLSTIAQITGDLNTSAIINVNNTKVEFNNITAFVLQEACPTCKTKFATKFPEAN